MISKTRIDDDTEYDVKCFDLAAVFLSDEGSLDTLENKNELASDIQALIEDFIFAKRLAASTADHGQGGEVMVDNEALAYEYLKIEKEIAHDVGGWVNRLRDVGVELSSLCLSEYVRDVIYQAIQDELSCAQSRRFDDRLTALLREAEALPSSHGDAK